MITVMQMQAANCFVNQKQCAAILMAAATLFGVAANAAENVKVPAGQAHAGDAFSSSSDRLASYKSGIIFIAAEGANSVTVADPETGKVEKIRLGVAPYNVETSSDGRLLYVVGASSGSGHRDMAPGSSVRGELLIYDATKLSPTPIAAIAVGRIPAHVIVNQQGTRAFVTNAGDGEVSVVDLHARKVVKTISVGALPHGLRMSPDGWTIFVANTGDGTVSVLDGDGLRELVRIPVGKHPLQVAFTPDGKNSYVTLRDEDAAVVIDTKDRRVVAKIPVGSKPNQIFAAPNGKEIYVANQGYSMVPGNTVSVIDTATQKVVADIVTGAGARGVMISPSGDRAFVSNTFAHTVSVIDPSSRRVIHSFPVGAEPGGIAFVPPKP